MKTFIAKALFTLLACVGMTFPARAYTINSDGSIDLVVTFDNVIQDGDIKPEYKEGGVWHEHFKKVSEYIYELTDGMYVLGKIMVRFDQGFNHDIIIGRDGNSSPLASQPFSGGLHYTPMKINLSFEDNPKITVSITHEFGHFLFGLYDDYAGFLCRLTDGSWARRIGNATGTFEWTQDKPTATTVVNYLTTTEGKSYLIVRPNLVVFDGMTSSSKALCTQGCLMNGSVALNENDPLTLCSHDSQFWRGGIYKYWEDLFGDTCYTSDLSFRTESEVGVKWYSVNMMLHDNRSCRKYVDDHLYRGGTITRPVNDPPTWEIQAQTMLFAAVICMDVSGSMRGAPLLDAKQGALALLDRLDEPERVGLVVFDSGVSTPVAIGMATPAHKQRIRNAVLGLSAGGGTSLYGAVDRAASNLVHWSNGSLRGDMHVFAFTDGAASDSYRAATVMGKCTSDGVRVHFGSLGNSVSVNDTLQEFSEETGGTFIAIDDSEDIGAFFAKVLSVGREQEFLPGRSGVITGGAVEVPFLVDAYANGVVEATLTKGDASQTLSLVDANGLEYTDGMEGVTVVDDGQLLTMTVEEGGDAPGNWTARVTGPDQSTYDLTFAVSAKTIPASLLVTAEEKEEEIGLRPIAISAYIRGAVGAISGAEVKAKVTAPNGASAVIDLLDDGKAEHNDQYANDGIYSGYSYDTYEVGTYKVDVTYANVDGMTIPDDMLSNVSVSNFDEPPAKPQPVAPFTREATVYATVTQAPVFINATRFTETAISAWDVDRATGALTGSLDVVNKADSVKTLKAPFWYALTGSSTTRLANPDGVTPDGDAYVDITDKVEAALLAKYGRTTMEPGESVTVSGISIYTSDRTQPELSGVWALWADPPTAVDVDSYDSNVNGVLDDEEILRAVEDWQHADMSDIDVLKRVRAWKQGVAE